MIILNMAKLGEKKIQRICQRATPCYFRKIFVGQDNKIEVKDVLKLDGEK